MSTYNDVFRDKIMKPTAINLAKFYGVSRETIRNYRDGTEEKQRLYKAMVLYFNINKRIEP